MESFKQNWFYWVIGAVALIAVYAVSTGKIKVTDLSPVGIANAADKGGSIPGLTRAEAAAAFPTNPWTAVYAGIGAGSATMVFNGGPFGFDGQQVSAILGGDVQINRMVLGLRGEAAWDHATALGNSSATEYALVGRAGFLITDSTLLYGLAGERWLQMTGLNTQGIQVGGGLEVAMTKNWRAQLEYDRVTYDALSTAVQQNIMARVIFALPR